MESDSNSWSRSFLVSGLFLGGASTKGFHKAMKAVLPKASAAGAPAPVAQAPTVAPVDDELDPDDPAMNLRRQLVGKAFALHVQRSQKVPKFEDITSEAKDLFTKHLFDGFQLEVQKSVSSRFATVHRVAFGQRNQEEPPSNYGLMAHAATKDGAVLVGNWNTSGNMMARVIKESKGSVLQASYQAMTNAKGEESTSSELEWANTSTVMAADCKYAFQMTPQGGAGVIEASYVRKITPGLAIGVHGLLIPGQGRCMSSFAARYERSFSSEKEAAEWKDNLDRAMETVEKLTEEDPISGYDACVLAAAFFKPRWVVGTNISPLQGAYDLSYVRFLSPSIILGSQISLAPSPPNPANPTPSFKAKWQIGYEYSSEPATSVKVGITNLETIGCVYEDAIAEFASVSVSAQANWPKDSYKTGFGLTFRL